MIELLLTLVLLEMALIVAFVLKMPVRGRGSIVIKSVALTVLSAILYAVYNVLAIRRRWIQEVEVNPTDPVLLHILEASLMGFSLFLALMIDRLYHYIRKLCIRRKTMGAMKKQNRVLKDGRNPVFEEINSLEE